MPVAEITTIAGQLDVTASTPTQMAECQTAMIEWMANKVVTTKSESAELQTAYEHAKKNKWRNDTLKRHWQLAEKRVMYYEKLKLALESGFYIVPPFPIEVFAIRTDKERPVKSIKVLCRSAQANFQQESPVLPASEGQYQNPHPKIEQGSFVPAIKPNESDKHQFWAEDWADIVFPINMSKPRIMEATSRAMALKIFDELGVLPQDYKRNPDPVIIGRIFSPEKPKWGNRKSVSFMIAWNLNTGAI